jgi:hypothetical protein
MATVMQSSESEGLVHMLTIHASRRAVNLRPIFQRKKRLLSSTVKKVQM